MLLIELADSRLWTRKDFIPLERILWQCFGLAKAYFFAVLESTALTNDLTPTSMVGWATGAKNSE